MRGIGYTPAGPQNLWIIENIHDGQAYTYVVDAKLCFKSTIPLRPMKCVPGTFFKYLESLNEIIFNYYFFLETSTYIDSLMYGYGDKQILADTWLFNVNETTIFAVVSRDDCVLLTANNFIHEPRKVLFH